MTQGWIRAWRKLYDPGHKLAPNKRDPSCRRDAWLDLCQMAQHQPHKHAGVVLQAGDVVIAVRVLADRWGWSKSRVSRFMIWLTSEAMIETVSGTPSGTVYRIVNYDTYAIARDTERDSQRDTERDASGTAAGQEQECKNERRGERAGRKVPVPDGWEPSARHREKADGYGVDVDMEAEKFLAHHEARGNRFVSWDRAFDTWLLKAREFAAADRAAERAADPRPHPYKPLLISEMPWMKDGAA